MANSELKRQKFTSDSLLQCLSEFLFVPHDSCVDGEKKSI